MKFARDFRETARNALRGRWGLAVGVGLVASLLGAGNSLSEMGVDISIENGVVSAEADLGILSFNFNEFFARWLPVFGKWLLLFVFLSVVTSVGMFILGSIVEVGYARFNLELIDDLNPEYGNLFAYFKHWKSAVLMNLLRGLYIFLWSLLFIIPGIIAAYRYSMASYILAEHPELPVNEAIARSKEMMRGNKGRLFCLELSFIGWDILCSFTFGIGNLWLAPYKKAAIADFYREVSDTRIVTYTDTDSQYDA